MLVLGRARGRASAQASALAVALTASRMLLQSDRQKRLYSLHPRRQEFAVEAPMRMLLPHEVEEFEEDLLHALVFLRPALRCLLVPVLVA